MTLLVFPGPVRSAPPTTLLRNPGFEQAAPDSAVAAAWSAFGVGYNRDTSIHHAGAFSLRCDNQTKSDVIAGASQMIVLNQTRPQPVLVSGWSRAASAGGSRDSDYSLYVDAEYTDGSPLYGVNAPFRVGTHDWQNVRLTLRPAKPLRVLTIYLLFRKHSGTAWFDDISATVIDHPFDSQALAPPVLLAGESSGWFARDVAAGGPVVPLKGLGLIMRDDKSSDRRVRRVNISNSGAAWRLVTVYYVKRVAAPIGDSIRWWNDIRASRVVGAREEATNLVAVPDQGAIGEMSLYPFGCVATTKSGWALAVPPDIGPRIQRIGYQTPTGLMYAAFDVAIPPRALATRRPPVRLAVASYPVDPKWGFRSAAEAYYKLLPQAFARRATKEGIWLPFTDSAKLPHVEDFGFAYHEGDNSIRSDNRLGILCFPYAEPMTYWEKLAPEIPRTYDAALAEIRKDAGGGDPEMRKQAQSVLLSGSEDEQGKFNVAFRNEPWANGAVWTLNPNPHLPHGPDEWTKARVNFPTEEAARLAPHAPEGQLAGEYLDSLEAWADVLDYRPESLAATTLPLTFSAESCAPTLPTWFSVWEFADYLSRYLHTRGKFLFANTALARFQAFAPLLDVMGIESAWGTTDKFEPIDDATFNFRRTMCHHKPYLLLQNNDYDKFGADAVARYMERCLFYGVFPSMFSANAADHPYWENPRWYERDRPTFKRYIPLIQRLSAAGWEPVTCATSTDSTIFIERYGAYDWSVLNSTDTDKISTIVIERAAAAKYGSAVREWLTKKILAGRKRSDGAVEVTVHVPAGATRVIEFVR